MNRPSTTLKSTHMWSRGEVAVIVVIVLVAVVLVVVAVVVVVVEVVGEGITIGFNHP